MIEDHARGRNLDPRPQPAVTRRPSPSLAARIKMLEADAEKRNGNNSRLSPSPSPHRSQSSVRARSVSAVSDLSGVSSTIEVPTSIPMTHTIFSNGDAGTPALKPPNELPPTPVEDESGSLPLSLLEENKLQKSFSMTNECPPSPRTLTPTVECYSIDTSVSALAEEFNSYMSDECGLHRRSSVLSLSRISFAAQLSRLTSLSLPLSEDLSDRIRNLATSVEMCDALMSAGEQIGRWIDTAKKVLRGLDAEDDVEWAAQGRESLNEVDAAVKKFSGLMNVYIELIDELQSRPDTESVNSAVLLDIVNAMESTHDGWKEVEVLLSGVKGQVETAMEWTELSTTILQDIQAELDACQTLVFELEEKRHRSRVEEQGGSVDIETLETIMEENPGVFPIGNPKTANEIEDSSLLGLFARMQPLRASLDFLPMRLQSFQMRAQGIFPSACNDLESRRKQLEKKWKKLNSDGDNLKKELGEDRWVSIFRNAGKQATAMLDSIERSMNKLKESVILWEESGCRAERDLMKKMENYEAKKIHYGLFSPSLFYIDLIDLYVCE
jgi:rubrerythrin